MEKEVLENKNLALSLRAFKRLLRNHRLEEEEKKNIIARGEIVVFNDLFTGLFFSLCILPLMFLSILNVGVFSFSSVLDGITEASLLSIFEWFLLTLMFFVLISLMAYENIVNIFCSFLFLLIVGDFWLVKDFFQIPIGQGESFGKGHSLLVFHIMFFYLLMIVYLSLKSLSLYQKLKNENKRTFLNFDDLRIFRELNDVSYKDRYRETMANVIHSNVFHYERLKSLGLLDEIKKDLNKIDHQNLILLDFSYRTVIRESRYEYGRTKETLLQMEKIHGVDNVLRDIDDGKYLKVEGRPKKITLLV